MIIDLLYGSMKEKGFVCVGLDTHINYVPNKFKGENNSETIFNFNKAIIDCTSDITAIYNYK